jgi:hypothetical protein
VLKFLDQPSLADASFAAHKYRLPITCFVARSKYPCELNQLASMAYKRPVPSGYWPRKELTESPNPDRLIEPADLHFAVRFADSNGPNCALNHQKYT